MGKIVWLASYPKSGNTWLRFFLYAYFKLDPDKDDRIDLNDPGLRYFSTQDVNKAWFEPFLDKPVAQMTPADAARHRRASHLKIAETAPGVVMVKTHNAFIADHGVHNVTAEATAGALYIVRNPLDVVSSLKDHFGHKSIGAAIRQLNSRGWRIPADANRAPNFVGSWSENVESWIGLRRAGVFPVRYEDMLAEPEKVFGWIIGVLGHDLDEAKLRWALDLTLFSRMQSAEAETGFEESPRGGPAFFRRGVAGGWRDALSAGQVKQIVEANYAMMRKFGYLDEKLERFVPKAKSKPKSNKTRR